MSVVIKLNAVPKVTRKALAQLKFSFHWQRRVE